MQNETPGTLAVSVAAEVRAEMARQKRGYATLAAHLKVSTQTVSRMLNARKVIDLSDLQAIGEFLGVDCLELVRRAGAPERAA